MIHLTNVLCSQLGLPASQCRCHTPPAEVPGRIAAGLVSLTAERLFLVHDVRKRALGGQEIKFD